MVSVDGAAGRVEEAALATPASGALTLLRGWRRVGEMPGAIGDAALVVPTLDRPAILLRLLDRMGTLPDVPADVAVVDASATGETEDALSDWSRSRKTAFDITYVRAPRGLTIQRNVGLDICQRDFLFFLDDDCLPEPGYFAALRAAFDEPGNADVAAVAGSIVNERNQPLSLRWRLRLRLGLVPRIQPGEYAATATSIPRSLVAPFTGLRATQIVPGGATVYRREALRAERFSRYFAGYSAGEDLEMSLRLGRRWRLLWSGDALVEHRHATAGRPDAYRRGVMDVRNRWFIWRRYDPSPSIPVRLRFWLDIGYAAAYDLAHFASRPRDAGPLRHAAGLVAGTASCILKGPRGVEPPAVPEFAVKLMQSP